MRDKLAKLISFEFKKNFFYSKNWLSSLMFLLVNMAIIPLTITPSVELLHQLFLPSIMTSMLLGVVLISNHVFDEDAADGTLDQYQIFGVPVYIIYLSKVVSLTVEFILLISIALLCSSLFYMIEFSLIFKIWIAIIFAIPLLMSVSVFGAMLTINLKKNAAIAILLTFPLLISVLIMISLAVNQILITGILMTASAYIEINLGITILSIPILCMLTKYLR